jgi:hypothetical protein
MTMSRPKVFLLSPANCGGMRARIITSPNARFPLALQMRADAGAPIGDVFSFVSGLYFRGKLAYARRFAVPPDPDDPMSAGIFIITPNAGLRTPDTPLTLTSFRAFSKVSIDLTNPSYRRSIERAALALREMVGEACQVVLLGSIASGKYVEVLQPIFGDNLLFPPAFVGRGDMSRGGLMLRCVADGIELDYAPVAGAIRHGKRPPKLTPVAAPRSSEAAQNDPGPDAASERWTAESVQRPAISEMRVREPRKSVATSHPATRERARRAPGNGTSSTPATPRRKASPPRDRR